MRPISPEYAVLFNAITDTETQLAEIRRALLEVQQRAEELYISATETKIPEQHFQKVS